MARSRKTGHADRLALLFCIASMIRGTAGIVASDNFVVDPKRKGSYKFTEFGFDSGGYMEVDLELTKPAEQADVTDWGTFLVACKKEPLSQAQNLGGQQEYCSERLPNVGCHHWVLSHGRHYVYEQINERVVMSLAVINCNQNTVVVDKVAFKLVNPNGEHLGTGFQPLPTMYMSFLLLWLALAMLQGVNWMCFKNFITHLHKLMLLVPCLKLIQLALGVLKWQRLSASGTSDPWLELVYVITTVVAQALTFAVLLLIGKGWLITRRILPSAERQATLLSVFMLVALFFAYYLITSFSFFALAIMHMAILAFILSSIARNVRLLKMQIVSLQSQQMDVGNTPVQTKAHMYRAFQVAMFMYVINKIVFQMLMLFLDDMPWLSYFFNELVEVALWASVGFTFRLRIPNPFNTGALPLMVSNSFLPEHLRGGGAFPRGPQLPEDDPRAGSPTRRRQVGNMPHIVVVENPPTIRDGRIVRNVAVGAPLNMDDKKDLLLGEDASALELQALRDDAAGGVGVTDAAGGSTRPFTIGAYGDVGVELVEDTPSRRAGDGGGEADAGSVAVPNGDALVAVDLETNEVEAVSGIRVGTASSPDAAGLIGTDRSERDLLAGSLPLAPRSNASTARSTPISTSRRGSAGFPSTLDLPMWPIYDPSQPEDPQTMAAVMAAAGIVQDREATGDDVVPFQEPPSPRRLSGDLDEPQPRTVGAWGGPSAPGAA